MRTFHLFLSAVMLMSMTSCFAQTTAKAVPTAAKATETLEWHTDVMKANELSRKTNKPIFAFFTGSDWCGWCKKLQRDVFAKPEFVAWAKENVILLELDFPRAKVLPEELKQQNAQLQQSFGVRGYPTIWMFYLRGEEPSKYEIEALGSCGYPQNAAQGNEQVKFLQDANAILVNKAK